MELAGLELVAGRNFLVRPGTMSNSTFEQSTIFEVVGKNRFEEVEVGNRFRILQSAADYNKRRKLVEKRDVLPALERLTEN